ncbi:Uncharacterized protein PCOAH_00012200 [Plasmodium coatneyi]|uniref:Uncharacterized protein n=1 Tax=Plasmodium coatneyi TaxID=208452 RepID=A0A1B1DVJ5_9APIC|nr:Uncharacterized protein PCOAH_00012200 [Plasmodium coatneyi]ANQ06811.1 Uncharacterized protein PCOAH_00012200 [Plasmodium coatneyi]
MVDLYKKPKNMSIGMYYGKDYMGRRRNYNYYGYSNKYGGYNYYNKLYNYRKGNYYEAQQGEKQQEEEVPVSDPPKEANCTDKTEGKKRKAEKETEKDEVGSRDKKKETSRKKCIIKILKRPTEGMSNEEGKGKIPVEGEKGAKEEAEKKELLKEEQKKKKKEKAKENEREGAKDCVEKKSKKKKDGERTTTKTKKVKDGFKFTSTQELFNLLLKDVKNDDEDDEMAKQTEKKKDTTTNGDTAKGPSEGIKMESENENAKKITKRSIIPDLAKKGERSTSGVKDTQPGRNDEEERIDKENEQGKSIKGMEGNIISDVPKSDKINEAQEKCPNAAGRSGDAQTGKTTVTSGNVKESAITLKGKKNMTSGCNKYNNQINVGSNISRGRKIKKIIKNVENGRYYYTGSRKDLAIGGFVAGHYVKYATSKYPNFTTSCNFLSHSSKMELCKNNSLNSRMMSNLNGGMGAGQRNDESKRAGKKGEEESFFAVPIYMRSPKPEQIPIPAYLSEGVDEVVTQNRVPEVQGSVQADVKAAIEAAAEVHPEVHPEVHTEVPPEAANVQGRKSPIKGQYQNVKGVATPNGNALNKDSQNALNFAKKNVEKKKKNKTFLNKNYMPYTQEQNYANKYNYDFMNTGNVKNNKVYNMHWLHPSHVKTTNYNGCNLHGNGKNLKMEKYFHNKRYKVKAYLSDNNQRSKNLNPLKEVKIAVY